MDLTVFIATLKNEPEKAFEQLFKSYYKPLCLTVSRIIPDQNQAKDIVQEVFADLWKRRDSFEPKTSIIAYLKRAAINKSLNHIRDYKIKTEGIDDKTILTSTAANKQELIEAEQLENVINKCINALPERCRLVFILSRYESKTQKEIAHLMGISEKTVENQMTKALKTLRNSIKKYKESMK